MQSLAYRPQTARRTRASRTILALMLREVSMSNGRSALGYLWEVVEPALGIVLMTALLQLYFRSPPIGNNFPLFYASGILPYTIFIGTASKMATAVRFSRALLNYPGVNFLHALIARFLLLFATKTVVFVIVLTAIIVIYDLSPLFDYTRVAIGLALAFGMGFAVGSMNCLLIAFLPLYERVWSLVTRPLFLFSAIIYLFQTVPLPYRDWLWWNPIVHMVGFVRSGLFPTYSADYASATYVLVLILICVPVSFFFMRRYWQEMIEI